MGKGWLYHTSIFVEPSKHYRLLIRITKLFRIWLRIYLFDIVHFLKSVLELFQTFNVDFWSSSLAVFLSFMLSFETTYDWFASLYKYYFLLRHSNSDSGFHRCYFDIRFWSFILLNNRLDVHLRLWYDLDFFRIVSFLFYLSRLHSCWIKGAFRISRYCWRGIGILGNAGRSWNRWKWTFWRRSISYRRTIIVYLDGFRGWMEVCNCRLRHIHNILRRLLL